MLLESFNEDFFKFVIGICGGKIEEDTNERIITVNCDTLEKEMELADIVSQLFGKFEV